MTKPAVNARILQITALPPGWHIDEDPMTALALVEVTFDDATTRTEVYYLHADLTLAGADEAIYYAVGSDDKPFATYSGPDWRPVV